MSMHSRVGRRGTFLAEDIGGEFHTTGRTKTVLTFVLFLASTISPLAAQDWAGKGRAGSGQGRGRQPDRGGHDQAAVSGGQPDRGSRALDDQQKGALELPGDSRRKLEGADRQGGLLPSEGALYVNEFQPGQAVVMTLERDLASSIQKGEQLLEAGEFAAARVEYEKAMRAMDDVGKARLRSRIGDTYMSEGDFAAARAEYAAAMPFIAPEEQTDIRLQMANSYQQEGEYSKARTEYEAIIPTLSPEGQASVLRTVAQGYGMQGNNAAAIETLEKVVTLVEVMPRCYSSWPTSSCGKDAIKQAEKYMDMLPEDVELPTDMVLNMGIRLYEGEMIEATEVLRARRGRAPRKP